MDADPPREAPDGEFNADGLLDDVDQADHCVIGCADVRHYVGHGITGTEGMPVSVAVRPEKIHLSRHAPANEDAPHSFNRAKGVVKNLSYFGSYTVYHLELLLLFATLIAVGPLVRRTRGATRSAPPEKFGLADLPG